MSWREAYQKGSFRGAPFVTVGHDLVGGRRTVAHEFPRRDLPQNEDLGRKYRDYSIECHVIGPEYRAARDALIDALEGAGPGLLVHPWLGQMQVSVLDYRMSEDTESGGMATFSIQCIEAGLPVPPPSVATGDAVGSAADAVEAEAMDDLADTFSIEDVAAFVEEHAGEVIAGAAALTQLAAGVNGGVGPALRAFEAGLRFLPANLAGLLKTPVALAQNLHGLVVAVTVLGGAPRARVTSFARMADYGQEPVILPAQTPQRLRQASNEAAIVHLFVATSAAEMVRAASEISFASYDDAVALRDQVAGQLDALALTAADAGFDDRAARFDTLRRVIVRDINARGGTLARVYHYRLATPSPALAIANRLYGYRDVEQRSAEIVARNRVVHPGFVTPEFLPNSDLQVLTYA